MNITIKKKSFAEPITLKSSIQNQSANLLYYQESVDKPSPKTGYVLESLKTFEFEIVEEDNPNLKCWLFNPNDNDINVNI